MLFEFPTNFHEPEHVYDDNMTLVVGGNRMEYKQAQG